jgi:hypothetical protein
MDATAEMPSRRRINPMSALMSAVTVASLIGAAWLRFAAPPSPGSPVVTVGAPAPLLWLLDLETSDPVVMVGLKGRVVWVVFWSADAPSGRSCLPELAAAWKGLKAHQQFALVTAAVETGDPGRGVVYKKTIPREQNTSGFPA